MKLAVVGSRGIESFDLSPLIPPETTEIISGGARGIDTAAARYARENGLPLREFLPEYEKYGRRAPLVRNAQIVEACDQVLAIWDGRSGGTMYTVRLAQSMGKPVRLEKIPAAALEGQQKFWK